MPAAYESTISDGADFGGSSGGFGMEPATMAMLAMGAGKMLGDFLSSETQARVSERNIKRQLEEAKKRREQEKLLAARSEAQNATSRQMGSMGQVGDRQASALDRITEALKSSFT